MWEFSCIIYSILKDLLNCGAVYAVPNREIRRMYSLNCGAVYAVPNREIRRMYLLNCGMVYAVLNREILRMYLLNYCGAVYAAPSVELQRNRPRYLFVWTTPTDTPSVSSSEEFCSEESIISYLRIFCFTVLLAGNQETPVTCPSDIE